MMLLLLLASQGATLGEVRAMVPPELRPPAMPSAAQNGWPLLLKASGSKPKPASFEPEDIAPPPPYSRTVSDVLAKWRKAPNAADLPQAMRALSQYQPRLRYLKEALAKPVWASPRRGDSVRPTLTPAIADFVADAGMKELAKALALRAHIYAFNGDGALAVADVAMGRQLGSRLAGGGVPGIEFLVGVAIEAIADDTALQISGYPKILPADLAALRKIVEAKPDRDRLANVIRVEFDASMVALAAGVPTDTAGLIEAGLVPKAWSTAGNLKVFDRKDTVRLLAMPFIAAIRNRERPWHSRVSTEPMTAAKKPPFFDLKKGHRLTAAETQHLKRWIRANPNPIGRQFASIMTSTADAFGEADRKSEARRRLTLTGIAVRQAFLKTKKMPASLEAVFWKGKVPGDPFGSGPIRYDAKSRRLWSVGADGRDDGGKGRPNAAKPDMVVLVP